MTAGYLLWQKYVPAKLSFTNTQLVQNTTTTQNTSKLPVRLQISALDIDVAVQAMSFADSHWSAPSQGIVYLLDTPLPGQMGNSVLYGHNWNSLLGNLNKAKVGQTITIQFSDKSVQNFTIQSIRVVSSNQAEVLDQSKDQRLTLYTCTGFWDQKRLVVVAKPQSSL